MKHYYQLEIPYGQVNEEKIYNVLYSLGFNNILDENGLIIITKPEKELSSLMLLMEELNTKKLVHPGRMYIERFEYQNWNHEWEKTIEPVYIKNKIVVTPSWHKKKLKRDKSLIVLEIDPKMSFGTGHNETTQLILEMMADYIIEKDKSMLDYGTGTGILAIAGIKLGLEHADAIDIDEDSVMNAKEYIKINHVEKKVRLIKSDITDLNQKKYDVITANINKPVITKNMTEIYKRLKANGKLFITGILLDEIKPVVNSLKRNKFELIESRRKAEWLAFYGIKK